jgi:hypothetical protein
MKLNVQTKPLLESLALAALLVVVAFGALLGEQNNPDLGTRAILVAGFGIPYLLLKAGVVKGNVIPTPFLIATWLAHFVLLVILFYSLQTGFNRRKARKHGATA